MPFDRWWYSADFATMERAAGYRRYGFDPAGGHQAFVDACDSWWEELSIGNKVDLWKWYE
ncbi:hypothetical protein FACS1894159_07640 [Bacteroidia bacterium]|nr:hypothetical protein FACS1894159_07640 [Bacteroidia bacterium]